MRKVELVFPCIFSFMLTSLKSHTHTNLCTHQTTLETLSAVYTSGQLHRSDLQQHTLRSEADPGMQLTGQGCKIRLGM